VAVVGPMVVIANLEASVRFLIASGSLS